MFSAAKKQKNGIGLFILQLVLMEASFTLIFLWQRYCAVPENIHTPPTKVFLFCTPPFPLPVYFHTLLLNI